MKIPKIQSSQDYDNFIMIQGNRNINQTKIDKIKSDIESGFNLLPYCPVIAYEKEGFLHIIDGQHRFSVGKQLGLPIYYVITDELNLYQIATMNSKQDKWSSKDFLKCYIELGQGDYKILSQTIIKYKIGISFAAELLSRGKLGTRDKIKDDFEQGKFKVGFFEETTELLELSHSIFSRYKFYTDRHLITAVQTIKEKGLCDFNFLTEKIKQAPNMMDKQSSVKEYIYNIERVYNHKASNRKVIY